MAREDKGPPKPTRLIDRDVFWTGLREDPPAAPARADDWLEDFLEDTREEGEKPPRPPKAMEAFREVVRGFEGRRAKVDLREELYDECYPRLGRGELAVVDDSSGNIRRKAVDIDAAYEVAAEKKKRRRGKRDTFGKVQASLRAQYDEEVAADDAD